MRNHLLLFCLFFFSLHEAWGYGLGFFDSSKPIDERTAYEVFADKSPSFSDRFSMEFDLSIMPPVQNGYILRFKTERDNDDLVYNLFVDKDSEDKTYLFRFNQEGKTVLISLSVDKRELTKNHWFKVRIDFDLTKDTISLTVGDTKKSCNVDRLPDTIHPQITFGRSEYFIDVPTMAINNLRIDGDESVFIPFNEDVGNRVSNSSGARIGSVENPLWLINSAYKWELDAEMSSSSRAGATYDMSRHCFYYFNKDTLKIYNPAMRHLDVQPFVDPCPVNLFLAGSFVLPDDNRMYVYEVYPADHAPGPLVASVDLDYLDWKAENTVPLKMQLHHHDFVIDKDRGGILFFGGFGNMFYSNTLYSFVPGADSFVPVDTLSGDRISPRYFVALGSDPDARKVYVYGGMGNDSGEQIVGRRYFYDLHSIDLDSGVVKKLWELPSPGENMVPARGMAVVDDSFFVLCYPESKSSSFLKLCRFSLSDGNCTVLGDSIPIKSDKITTNAHLWYDSSDGKFYVSVQETDDDIRSTLKIYSLSYPPVSESMFRSIASTGNKSWIAYVVVLAILVSGGLLVMYIRSRNARRAVREHAARVSRASGQPQSDKGIVRKPNSIFLFGNFEAVNSSGRDIGYLFTGRLRAILLLILQYNNKEGITTGTLGSLIWPDRPKEKVKNSRGVAINSLRKILGEFQGITLTNIDSHLRLEYSKDFYCDYLRCVQLISDEDLMKTHRIEFLEIVSRGKFLKDFEDPVCDDFKREFELLLEQAILRQIELTFENGYYRECVRLVQAEFNIDPVNEQALRCGVRALHFLSDDKGARRLYHHYAEEYLKSSGEKMPTPFEEFLH